MGKDGPSRGERPLLGSDDPDPVGIVNRPGRSPFLLLGDHAGNAIPAALGSLGLSAEDRQRHIALDIGTYALGQMLAERLDATFVHQRFSRLVIDCNRNPERDDACPAVSDGTDVIGNQNLTEGARNGRVDAIHAPYHATIAGEVARRRSEGRQTILISLHSFTPRLRAGELRRWSVGILHDGRRDAVARSCLSVLAADPQLVVGDNEPYRMDDTDYTVPRHAFPEDLPYVEVEIRQDLLATEPGISGWAGILAHGFIAAAGA